MPLITTITGAWKPGGENEEYVKTIMCPYGKPGTIMWVRETWSVTCGGKFEYKADGGFPPRIIHESANESGGEDVITERWFPSIHMPYTACRLFLRITDIRVERLQDISPEDAIAEGVERWTEERLRSKPTHYKLYYNEPGDDSVYSSCPVISFQTLWQSINGPDSWEANPWTWCVSFERIDKPE